MKVSRNGVASKSGLMSMTHIDNAQDPHFHPIEVLVANRRRRMLSCGKVHAIKLDIEARIAAAWHHAHEWTSVASRGSHLCILTSRE